MAGDVEFQQKMLKPIHVTSFRNGIVHGHNCWHDEECELRCRTEHSFGPYVEGIVIGKRYLVDHMFNWVAETVTQPTYHPCAQTIVLTPCIRIREPLRGAATCV